ncbi:MAG TPA: tetratricopeptide repeat protein, partial [Pedobacter sp.]|nr:tetratricopeptide repeat protein [Pedobacter sp.]
MERPLHKMLRSAVHVMAVCLFLCMTALKVFAENRDTIVVDNLLKTAGEKSAKGEVDSAEQYYIKAGLLASKLKFHAGFFRYASHYASMLYEKMRYHEALKISEEQLALSLKIGDEKQTARAYNNIALQYHALGDFHKTADYFIKALRLSETLNDPLNQRKFYTNLASLFLDMKDKAKSLYYARKGYEVAKKMKDETQMARSLVNLACAKILNEHYDDATRDFLEVIAYGRRSGDIVLEITGVINIADIHNRKKEYKNALLWNQKGLKMLNRDISGDYEIHILAGL